MNGPAKIFALLPDDLATSLLILVLCAACTSVYRMVRGDLPGSENVYIISAAGFALGYSLLLHVFRNFAKETASVLAVASSAILLAILLWDGNIALPVYLVWAAIKLCPGKLHPEAILCAASDVVMIFAWFFAGVIPEDPGVAMKAAFAALFVLSLYHACSLIRHKEGGRYPFAFFAVLMVLLMIVPVRSEPINWDPVINVGRKVAETTKEIAWSVSYRFSDVFAGSSYSTGYSSFDQNGDTIRSSERTELELKTMDNTSFAYTDEASGKRFMRRRTVYLNGSTSTDHSELLDFLYAMYLRDVDKETGKLFAQKGAFDITYTYLKTPDEIIPSCPIKITDQKGNPITGQSENPHRKGYRIHTDYLDIDHGSPYLEKMMASPVQGIPKGSVSYDTMADYAYNVFSVSIRGAVSEDEYASWQASDSLPDEYLDTDGATGRMKELALDITGNCADEYDKCRAIESCLRQYRYRTDTGSDGGGNTGSAEGMSRIADRFLFETGEGYCVHYASSMIMLLRLNDIPARLRAGYRYTFPFERQEEYEVSAHDAHVWPEAYISGFGWVGFEPTSGMSTSRERTWHREPSYGKAGSASKSAAPYIPANIPSQAATDGDKDTGPVKGDMNSLMKALRIALIIASAVVLMAALLTAFARLYKTLRYKRASEREKLIMDVEDITGIIRSISSKGVTDRGVLSDYEPFVPERFRDRVSGAFDIYYRIKYGRRAASGEYPDVTHKEVADTRTLRELMHKEYRRLWSRKNR